MIVSRVVPLVVIFVSGAWAQFDQAQCPSGFDWNKNSLGQDPCTVGSMLDASCRGLAEYTYPPLNATQYYLPPRANHSGDVTCDCNTVMYSLYMACSSCQGGTVYPWIQWVPQCPSVYISQYPVDIAQGTAVPHWAYFNVTSLPGQNWTEANAITVGRDPEELPKQINTVASGSSSGHNTVSKTSSGSPGPTGGTNTKSGTNVGAIVGGVVGTIVPLTILGIVLFLYVRHRKQKAATQQPQLMGMPPPDDDPYKHRPISYGAPMPSPPIVPLVQYDPSDPSTFPPQSPPTSVTYTTQPNNTRGAYSGMPEV